MSKERKLDKLLELEKKLTFLLSQKLNVKRMFDSDVRVAMALLEEIRKLNQNKDE